MALNAKRTVFHVGKTDSFSYTLQTKKDGFAHPITFLKRIVFDIGQTA